MMHGEPNRRQQTKREENNMAKRKPAKKARKKDQIDRKQKKAGFTKAERKALNGD